MNKNHMNSRRDFVKKMALPCLVTLSVPEMNFLTEMSDNKSKRKTVDKLVILFQGDSITDGNRGRNTDPNHIMGHGYAFSIASRIGADFPEKKLTFYNRGISGNKVTDLKSRWQKDTLDLKPDVISILIGINDSGSVVFPNSDNVSVSPEKFAEVYKSLLDQTRAEFPGILFVLCNPFILPVGKVKDNWDAFNNDILIRQNIVTKLADKYNAVFVDFQDVFNKACYKADASYWIWDGVHPTVPGHELMAREWIKQVSKKLKFINK